MGARISIAPSAKVTIQTNIILGSSISMLSCFSVGSFASLCYLILFLLLCYLLSLAIFTLANLLKAIVHKKGLTSLNNLLGEHHRFWKVLFTSKTDAFLFHSELVIDESAQSLHLYCKNADTLYPINLSDCRMTAFACWFVIPSPILHRKLFTKRICIFKSTMLGAEYARLCRVINWQQALPASAE